MPTKKDYDEAVELMTSAISDIEDAFATVGGIHTDTLNNCAKYYRNGKTRSVTKTTKTPIRATSMSE